MRKTVKILSYGFVFLSVLSLIWVSALARISSKAIKQQQSIPSKISDKSGREILKRNREMEKVFMCNDFSKLAGFYTENAVLIGEKQEIKGKTAINEYWSSLKDKGLSWNLENIQIEIHGNMAIQRGISRMKFLHSEKEFESNTRFTLIWKKTNNIWYIQTDHYSKL